MVIEVAMGVAGTRRGSWRTGVFTVRRAGYEKLVYKTKLRDRDAADRLMAELLDEIHAGSLRWG